MQGAEGVSVLLLVGPAKEARVQGAAASGVQARVKCVRGSRVRAGHYRHIRGSASLFPHKWNTGIHAFAHSAIRNDPMYACLHIRPFLRYSPAPHSCRSVSALARQEKTEGVTVGTALCTVGAVAAAAGVSLQRYGDGGAGRRQMRPFEGLAAAPLDDEEDPEDQLGR